MGPHSRPNERSPFVEVGDLNYAYSRDGNKVLKDLFLRVPKKGTLAVVGGSGTGKSTLLKLLGGLLSNGQKSALSGTMRIGGATPDDYRRSGKLSFIFQDPTLLDHQTVLQNISLPLRSRHEERDHAKDLAEVLRVVGLNDFASYLPRQLSGGMKTRVSLARAFVGRPELLLLDEPFSALDIAWRSRLYGYYMDLRERFETTSVLVTHDIQEAVILADEILMIDHHGSAAYLVEVKSSRKGRERLESLNAHLKEVYDDIIAPLQQQMVIDGRRRLSSGESAESILARVRAGDTLANWELRPHSKQKQVHDFLVEQLRSTSSLELKYQVLWDILNYDHPDMGLVTEIRDLYLSQLDTFSKWSLRFYACTPMNFYDFVMASRFSRTDIPAHKRWIYYFDLLASSERGRVREFVANSKAEARSGDPFLSQSLELLDRKLNAHA